MSDFLTIRPDGVLLQILVQPRASKNEIVGPQEGELKVRLTSPPVEGAANELCRQFFAKQLRLPKRDITIVSGEKSRHKRLCIKTDQPKAVRDFLLNRTSK
ncbi:MAG: YggU family protein [Deltaproteobacteria bacterium]|nr:YggU family protein [Deltaproteobacteria bacterium]